MKFFLVCVIILFASCGENLIGDEEEFRPSSLTYTPDSVFFDTTIHTDSTVFSTINQGSGSVTYKLISPNVTGLTINTKTGALTIDNNVPKELYYVSVQARNFVGAITFPSVMIFHVK